MKSSKLSPYQSLIGSLRKEGKSYREIVQILGERYGLRVGRNTVHSFVKVRSKRPRKVYTLLDNVEAAAETPAESQKRLAPNAPFRSPSASGLSQPQASAAICASRKDRPFLNWPARLGDQVSYVVFKNEKDGDELFDYENSTQAMEFRKRLCPAHIVMPKLSPLYQAELEIRRLTFYQVLEGEDGNSVDGQPLGPVLGTLMARARLRSFQTRIFEQLDTISMTLLPRP